MTSPNLSKKEIDNSLYKSFYVVNKTQIERLNLIFKFGGCDCLGSSFFVSHSIHCLNTRQPFLQESFKIQCFIYLTLPRPLNIKPHSRTLPEIFKNPNLVLIFQNIHIKIGIRAH